MKPGVWLLALTLGSVQAGSGPIQRTYSMLGKLDVERLMRVTVCPDGQRFALGKLRVNGIQSKAIEPSRPSLGGFVVQQPSERNKLELVNVLAGDPRALACTDAEGENELLVASTVEAGVLVERINPRSRQVVWASKVIEGDAQAEDLVVDMKGVPFLLSTGRGKITGTTALGEQDVIIQRLGDRGVPRWTQRIGTSAPDKGVRLALEGSTGVWVSGNTQGDFDGAANSGGQDGFLVRLEAENGLPGRTQMVGTPQNDVINALTLGKQGVYVAGFTYGALEDKQNGEADAFVAGYTLTGESRWRRQFGTPQADAFTALITLPNGDLLAAGYSDTDGQANPISTVRHSQLVRFQMDGEFPGVTPMKNALGASLLDLAADAQGRVYAVGLNDIAGLYVSWNAVLNQQRLIRMKRLAVNSIWVPR